jgi:hypothetical protein
MSPLEALLAEARPDGTFGGKRHPAPWTPDEQARHRADLLAALDGTEWQQPIPTRRPASRQRKANR